ncbi:MAG: hypothetical protein R6U44_04505 [Archaeoglobaceae archaeon]
MSKYNPYIFKQLLDERKKRLKVFVMGAFVPDSSKDKLLGLRSNLRKEGYDARIAEDFEAEPKTDEEVFYGNINYRLSNKKEQSGVVRCHAAPERISGFVGIIF